MSYDIRIFRPAPETPIEQINDLMEATEVDEESLMKYMDDSLTRSELRQALIPPMLKAFIGEGAPDLDPGVFEEDEGDEGYPEDIDEESGEVVDLLDECIQEIFADIDVTAGLEGEDTEEMFSRVWEALELIYESGFVAYDFQMGRIIDVRTDQDAFTGSYADTMEDITDFLIDEEDGVDDREY